MTPSLKVLVLLAFPGCVLAQQPSPTPIVLPKPIIARAPAFSRWTITTSGMTIPKEGRAISQSTPAALVARQIMVTKTDPVRLEATAFADGGKMEKWCIGASQITTNPAWKEKLISNGHNPLDGSFVDYSKSDFVGFEWISQANFVEARSLGGRTCWVFQKQYTIAKTDQTEQTDASVNIETYAVQVTAYIDTETQLPVLLRRNDESEIYNYLPPPREMLTPPEAVKSTLADLSNREQALRKPLPRPF